MGKKELAQVRRDVAPKGVHSFAERQTCPECKTSKFTLDKEHGELICSNCNTIVEEGVFDYGPEWRAFDADQMKARARTGPPIHDRNKFKTLIDMYLDGEGNNLSDRAKERAKSLNWQNKFANGNSSVQKNLNAAVDELSRMASDLSLPEGVKEVAISIYTKCTDTHFIAGRSATPLIGAVLYAACRQLSIPVEIARIAKELKMPKKSVGRTFKKLKVALDLDLPPPTARTYLQKVISDCGLGHDSTSESNYILEKLEDKKPSFFNSKNPVLVCASIVNLACINTGEKGQNMEKTLKYIATQTGKNETQIRRVRKEIESILGSKEESPRTQNAPAPDKSQAPREARTARTKRAVPL